MDFDDYIYNLEVRCGDVIIATVGMSLDAEALNVTYENLIAENTWHGGHADRELLFMRNLMDSHGKIVQRAKLCRAIPK